MNDLVFFVYKLRIKNSLWSEFRIVRERKEKINLD